MSPGSPDPKAVVWLASRPQDGDNSMADLVDLVVIGYPDEATAEKAYEVVLQLEHDLVMQVAGAAVVVKHADGKAKMVTKTGATRAGAMMGGFFGLLFGLLFLIPVGGLILGGIMGAVMGTMTGWGIKDDFRQRVPGRPEAGHRSARPVHQEVDRGQGPRGTRAARRGSPQDIALR